MKSIGQTIRKLRRDKQLPLRTVAAFLDIDQAILSKIERGQRDASREQVVKLAGFFNVNENDLLVTWLSDRIVYEVEDEELALKSLQVAEEKIKYKTKAVLEIPALINTIKEILEKDGRVAVAWLFGSTVTGEANPDSDVDIMIELNDNRKYSMFDLLDISHTIEQKIKRRVDLVEKGQFHAFAWETASQDLQKIYG